MLYRVSKEPELAAELADFFGARGHVESFVKTVFMSAPFADPLVRQLKLVRERHDIRGDWRGVSVLGIAALLTGDVMQCKKSLLSTFAILSVCRPSELDAVMFANALQLELIDWHRVSEMAPAHAIAAIGRILDGCEDEGVAMLILNNAPTFDVLVHVCAQFDLVPRTEVAMQLVDLIRRCRCSSASLDSVLLHMPGVETVKMWTPDGSLEAAIIDRARLGDTRAFSWLTSRRPMASASPGAVDGLVSEYRRACSAAHSRADLASLMRMVTFDAAALEAAVERWEATLEDDVPNCPLTCRPIVSPMVDTFGRTFERLPLLAWLARSGTHPLTRESVTPGHFTPGDQI